MESWVLDHNENILKNVLVVVAFYRYFIYFSCFFKYLVSARLKLLPAFYLGSVYSSIFQFHLNYFRSSSAILFYRRRSFICMLLTSCKPSPFMAWQRPSYISAIILRGQRQIFQQWLYKVHSSIIIRVTRDFSNIETIVQ